MNIQAFLSVRIINNCLCWRWKCSAIILLYNLALVYCIAYFSLETFHIWQIIVYEASIFCCVIEIEIGSWENSKIVDIELKQTKRKCKRSLHIGSSWFIQVKLDFISRIIAYNIIFIGSHFRRAFISLSLNYRFGYIPKTITFIINNNIYYHSYLFKCFRNNNVLPKNILY